MAAGAARSPCRATTAAIVGAVLRSSGTADLVGYGARDCFEGRGADRRAPSNTTAALRKRGGCFDSDNNNIDFSIGNPAAAQLAHRRRAAARPMPAAIHDIQGDGCVLAARRTRT